MSIDRSSRNANRIRQVLRSAGFEAHARYGIWISVALRKIISEAVVSSINVTQLVCWIKRPAPLKEWSAWFHKPIRLSVLNGVIGNCTPASIGSRPSKDESVPITDYTAEDRKPVVDQNDLRHLVGKDTGANRLFRQRLAIGDVAWEQRVVS